MTTEPMQSAALAELSERVREWDVDGESEHSAVDFAIAARKVLKAFGPASFQLDAEPANGWPPIRCNQHRDRDTIPPPCPVCQRLAVEQDIVIRVIDAMLAAGYSLQTDILGGDARPAQPTKDRDSILSEMMAVDDEFLGVFDDDPEDDRPIGWVRFVYGNDGWDVVSDYTTNLESILAPINQYADTLG